MINRFRKSDNLGYQAVLAELAVHAALKRQGYVVEVHPPCGHPRHKPDFLARDANGSPVAFVEVTSFGPVQEEVARSTREAAIYNAIDKVKLPAGWRLGYLESRLEFLQIGRAVIVESGVAADDYSSLPSTP